MSLNSIHLRKLLQMFYASNAQRIKLLREDIRAELKRDAGTTSGGGDFYGPFWADAKAHVAGTLDLQDQVKERIAKNPRRGRLYKKLAEGFLAWWNEKRRWRNEKFELILQSIKKRWPIPGRRDAVVKVENLLALKVGDDSTRLIYPYYVETPSLGEKAARVGLWLMGKAFPDRKPEDMRMLDVQRGVSLGLRDVPLKGDEEELFLRMYEGLVRERKKLRKDYDPED